MRKPLTALAVAGALLVASCESLLTGGPLIRPGEPTGIIRINNGSHSNVTVVLISDCDQNTYGLNRLPEGVYIPPGRYYDFRVSAGCWDTSVGYGHADGVGYSEARQRMQVPAGSGVNYTVTGD